MGRGSLSHFTGDFRVASLFSGRFATSLIFISFAYSGWNAAAYLGGEIRNPGRNIPLALFAGTIVVTLSYLALNALYVYALPIGEMSGVVEVGEKAASALFGAGTGRLLTGAIAVGILSALSAMILTGPRVYYAMSRDGAFFSRFGKVDDRRRTPVLSIALQAVISICMILTSSFETLLLYIGFTLSLFSVLDSPRPSPPEGRKEADGRHLPHLRLPGDTPHIHCRQPAHCIDDADRQARDGLLGAIHHRNRRCVLLVRRAVNCYTGALDRALARTPLKSVTLFHVRFSADDKRGDAGEGLGCARCYPGVR